MVNDNSRPQRKSTRPASGTQRRSTGAQPQRPRTGQTRTGQGRTGQTRTGQTKTGQTRTGQTRTGGGSRGGGGARGPATSPTPRWKFWLRRIGAGALVTGLVVATIGIIGLAVRYNQLPQPEPDDFALYQSSTVYYADGTTVMGRLGQADREVVDAMTLPSYVRNAFVAAEDRTFYDNPGIDAVGTARALFNTVVLDRRQGGSSITQQYVERYYVGETTTDIVGKIDEALLALKIDSQQSKDEILGNYINTVYFGRGAYGIQAAAREYFGKSAAELTISEAALLAGILPAPSRWDPRFEPEQAEFRWNYVLDGMVDIGEITQAERDILTFPTTIEYANEDVYGGPQGYLLRAALNEVEATTGITQEQIETQGYSIVTTFDAATQQSIEAAVAAMPEGAAPNLRVAALTMDPTTGAVTGMYGGADYLEIQRNAVTQDIAQAGSTFKPFTLVAALESGVGLGSIYDGNQPRTVPGFDNRVGNFAGQSFGDIDLVRATAYSVNTVYAQLNADIGPERTRDVAIRAGIPEDTVGLEANPANVLGTASPHALDLASAYSTFATGGLATEPYMVSQVLDTTGETIYQREIVQRRVIDADVMADATFAMQQVVNYGSGRFAQELGRPIAGKTGTANDNRSAWFAGFVPQQVGVVGLYQVGPNGEVEEITPFGGFDQITGGSVPVRIWTAMMGPILSGLDVIDFPPPAYVGVDNVPSPSPTPSPTPTPSPSPSPSPSPTPEPEPSPEPEPTPSPTPDPGDIGDVVDDLLGG